ncbi:serine--tRNA ligase [Candidatus Berkelbacteria bacterium CG10_big_fil_rev_8_21_14_0_10_43_13]|uniref:Serine--tRNA ligase n=1 Tax=Candidatus Berkelbacteria bacterium CG10_big_fil_rev_8_21_14_0_10_43_13 TaxID=1974514 RepID=A0A2H0W8X0_9BACT|nr:MAG: serine--tRNA ligase [Candidatus Berkelbacteria bacterium CG10_big_fil_rev_8_21_14_0_10_43_13]
MLDIKLIREKPEEIKKAIARKGAEPALIDELLDLDKRRRDLIAKIERFQTEVNIRSKEIVQYHGQQKIDAINDASESSEKIKQLKPELEKVETGFREIALEIPNPPSPEVIDGESDKDNTVNRTWGEKPNFDFKPLDNIELAEKLNLFNTERATKVAGSRFYYLTGDMVIIEQSLFRFALDFLVAEKFIPVIPPVLVNRRIMEGAGYIPGGEDEIYKTQDDLYLAGTSEQPLAGYHLDEIFSEKDLPLRYAGISTCFRREAGSHGKDVRGILRGHQFNKIEMFSFVKPEDSTKEHDYMVSLEEKLMQKLKLPYQVINICAGDLGAPAAKKFDIEAWLPSEGKYRETHSCSNCTDFQARRLNIRYKNSEGKTDFVHTLNGTAFAERPLLAILENYQQKDGSVKVPEVLQKYTGFSEIKR